ncbi:MAG TPA: ABC transporter permease subunit [Sedimentisphaerales bacterium]|nr:ABC transporter permease subunit [Sedimentisphaerales bacterium]
MSVVVVNRFVRLLTLGWLIGPIFDKEMRVSSRRRRNYVLRFLYIGLFAFLLAVVWAETVPYQSAAAYQSSRMAIAGQAIVSTVLWFEFITVQVIAVVMLSTSISDEIYHRTLGVLMTTPIGSFQIVVGKLLSRLLQLVLLLAISLPPLAVVRVFGGVPGDFLACGLCVTLTTALFVGSLSLFFSILTRRAYTVILTTIVTLGLLFLLVPLGAAFLAYYPHDPPAAFWRGLSLVNPYLILFEATVAMQGVRVWGVVPWPIHCGAMLGASGLLLLLSMTLVRKAALRQAMGLTGLWSGRGSRKPEKSMVEGRVARVKGPPVLWKECRIPLLGRRRVMNLIGAIAILALIGLTYGLCYRENCLDDGEIQSAYMIVFFAVGMLFTIVLPATCIASEKEAQTWSLLLTTSLGEWQILAGKFGGVVRRCLPAWGLLFAHVVAFSIVGYVHPAAILQFGLIAAWTLVFLSGAGLCFSQRFKHTTTAVIANMGLAATLWAIIPLIAAIVMVGTGHGDSDWIEPYLDMNPFVQAGVVAMATAHSGGLGAYEWAQGGLGSVGDATAWIVLTALAHGAVGLALAAWTGSRLRRNVR